MLIPLYSDDDEGYLITSLPDDGTVQPQCGEDYCDSCSDCLACYTSDDCYPSGEHLWLLTVERYAELLEAANR